MKEKLDYALYYAKFFPVFPLTENYAMPFKGSNGFKDATQDSERLERWYGEVAPDSNIGASFIDTDYFVVDLDRKKGKDGLKSLRAIMPEGEKLNSPPIVKTKNNGLHLYYRTPEEIKNTIDWLTGVDIIKNFCIMPPTTALNEKGAIGEYKFTHSSLEHIAEPPEWLLKAILDSQQEQGKPKVSKSKLSFEMLKTKTYTASFMEQLLEGAESGNRNNWLTQQTGRLFGLGMESSYVYEWLHVINERFLAESLPDEEVNTIFKSILQRENNKRREGG